ncbi:MAG: PINc/VapC family ATPase [Thaumarchaeota archaeon]|nr:PINc/VapC family ATPase [Nitrososphaerota archaeon]MCZ6725530.1 PINc/VapC family ATPase [Nitrososphaerota archaeon]
MEVLGASSSWLDLSGSPSESRIEEALQIMVGVTLKKYVPDTSVLVDGRISQMLASSELSKCEIIVPAPVIDELQAQASKNREPGFLGLQEVKKVREMCEKEGISFSIQGRRPDLDEIKLARSGRIDAIIRDIAKDMKGTLITADYVQALVGEAEGTKVLYVPQQIKTKGLEFEKYFTKDTLSLHLKEGALPVAKRGLPGKFRLIQVRKSPSKKEDLQQMIKQISEASRVSKDGFVEIRESGVLVMQLGKFRIALIRPPLSDGLEVTIVKPLVDLELQDYKISKKLMDRLQAGAEGIIIAGPPGSGKSTLAGSLAKFYSKQGSIVKTLESPRDLQVGPEITQYGPLNGDFEKIADILLLVRPDYTIFDEIRKTKDFRVYTDLRLAGVGMVGVVHASGPVDAVQRFIGRVELGMIPNIMDTIIYVKDGEIRKVLELRLLVKVPSGMIEADLARPVVEIHDFETNSLEYEIYTFGEENVIIPVREQKSEEDSIKRLAKERIQQIIHNFDRNAEVDILSPKKAIIRVDKESIARLIGKGGVMITEIEERLGIKLDVEAKIPSLGQDVNYEILEKGNSLDIIFESGVIGKEVSLYIGQEYLLSAIIGRKSKIRLSRSSEAGKKLVNALLSEKSIDVVTHRP